jgi:eukaryotic-like serine/threonine-protein kinase
MKIRFWIGLFLVAAAACDSTKTVWQWKLESRSYGEPVTDDKNAYVVSQAGEVIAGDYRTGKINWKHKVDGPILAAPALSETSLFTATENGFIVALDKNIGKELWKIQLKDTFLAPLSTISDLVLVPSGTGILRAISQSDGKTRWEYSGNKKYNSQAMVSNDHVLIGGWAKKFQCFRLDGTLNWSYTTGGILVEDATVFRNSVVFSARDDHIYSLETPTGKFRWRFPVKSPTRTILVDQQIVFADDEGILYILRSEDGALLKRIFVRKRISQIYPSPKGCLIIADQPFEIDLKSGDISLLVRLPDPVFKLTRANGMIVVTDQLYNVFGVRLR